jgi:hypothetical protein
MRTLKLKMFIGSTLEEIELQFNKFFEDKLCPGNLIETNLYMYGGVYQYEVLYAEFKPVEYEVSIFLPGTLTAKAEKSMPVSG